MRPSLILWDWNGTLLDDVALCVDCLNRLLAEHGYPQRYNLAQYRAIFGFPIRDYYIRAGFDFAHHPFAELAARYMEQYLPASEACGLMPDAPAALAAMQAAGRRQVILSASQLPTLRRQVEQRGIADYFEALLGLNDIYAQSKVALGTAWLAGAVCAPAQCVLVGDSVHDWEVAQALGTACVLCAAGHQSRTALAATGAPVIDTLAQLEPALQAL